MQHWRMREGGGTRAERRALGWVTRTAFVGIIWLSACSPDAPAPVGPSANGLSAATLRASASAKVKAAVDGVSNRGIEDEFLRIEAVIPGFGGFFISNDKPNTIVAYVTDLSLASDVRNAVMGVIRAEREGEYNALRDISNVEVRKGKFPFSSLVVWQGALSQIASGEKAFAWIDADESQNRVTIGVTDDADESGILRLAGSIGIPNGAIVFESTERGTAYANLQAKWRPTAGGIQITPIATPWTCTLGINVSTFTGGTGTHFISAGHCVNQQLGGTGSTGSSIYQSVPSDLVGTVVANPPWNSLDPSCGAYTLCTESDVMLVQYSAGIVANKQVKITSGLGSINVTSAWNVTSWVTPTMGLTLEKMGRTTGWSRGPVTGTCMNVALVVTGLGTAMELCVDQVNANASNGDSGASVFYNGGGSTAPMSGILVGGATGPTRYWFTNWGRITGKLGPYLPY